MIRKAVLFASCWTLASCATRSADAPPLPPPAAQACDPRLLADVQTAPRRPDSATLVKPVGPVEIAAVDAYLNWVAETRRIGERNAERARLAKAECEKRR